MPKTDTSSSQHFLTSPGKATFYQISAFTTHNSALNGGTFAEDLLISPQETIFNQQQLLGDNFKSERA